MTRVEQWELWDGAPRKVLGVGASSSCVGGNVAVIIHDATREAGFMDIGGYILPRDPDTVLVPDVAFLR